MQICARVKIAMQKLLEVVRRGEEKRGKGCEETKRCRPQFKPEENGGVLLLVGASSVGAAFCRERQDDGAFGASEHAFDGGSAWLASFCDASLLPPPTPPCPHHRCCHPHPLWPCPPPPLPRPQNHPNHPQLRVAVDAVEEKEKGEKMTQLEHSADFAVASALLQYQRADFPVSSPGCLEVMVVVVAVAAAELAAPTIRTTWRAAFWWSTHTLCGSS